MARYADDILPARRPAQRYVPVLAAAASAVGASAFAVALIRAIG